MLRPGSSEMEVGPWETERLEPFAAKYLVMVDILEK